MSFSSLNTRTLLFACPMFTVIENIGRHTPTHKKREKKMGKKKKIKIRRTTPGLLHVQHQNYRRTPPFFIDVVSYVSMPFSNTPPLSFFFLFFPSKAE